MKNQIVHKQNTKRQLERLAAQRQLYSEAKTLQLMSAVLSVPMVVLLSIIVVFFPQFRVLLGLWGISISILDIFVFSRLQKSIQEKAAEIQQFFDCDVLEFSWEKLKFRKKPEPETIIAASERFKSKGLSYSTLRDWYPSSISQLSIYQARIICQRCNIRWDSKLRRRYSTSVFLILIIMTITIFLIGLAGGLTLEKFLLVIFFPLAPVYIFGCRQYLDNHEKANRLDYLKNSIEGILQKIIDNNISPQQLDRESHTIQEKIDENRRLSPLISDWIYYHSRQEDENQMNKSTELLIQELKQIP